MILNLDLQQLDTIESVSEIMPSLSTILSNNMDADGKEYAILGNPNLGEVRIFFLGVENRTRDNACTEVWFNELRLGDLNENGGWAALGRVDFKLADLGTLYVSGKCQERRVSEQLNKELMKGRGKISHSLMSLPISNLVNCFLRKQASRFLFMRAFHKQFQHPNMILMILM